MSVSNWFNKGKNQGMHKNQGTHKNVPASVVKLSVINIKFNNINVTYVLPEVFS